MPPSLPAPRSRRRQASRLVACWALVALALVAPAEARWSGAGAGTGTATADTLGAGMQPTASSMGATVTVTFTQTSFRGAPLGAYAEGSYLVQRRPEGGTTRTTACAAVTGTAATLSCVESGVPAGTWRYSVTPRLSSWTGAESAASAAVTIVTAAPTLNTATAQNPPDGATTGAIELSWTGTGAAGYNVYRRAGAGAYDYATPLNGATPVTGTTYTDPGAGLSGGTTYSYVVRGTTGGGESPSSNERSATAVARPAAPATLSASLAPAARIDLSWAAVPGASGYVVHRRTAAGAYDFAAPLSGATPITATTFADTTSVHGTSYRYVVRAVGPGTGTTTLQSVNSPEASATADGVAPATSTATDPGANLRASVALAGTASDAGSGVASLRLQLAPAGTTTFTDACTATTSPYSCAFDTTARADGLYDLRAVATDVAGNVTTSASVVNRRIDNTAPAATMGDPGAFIRGTVTLTATASDGGSGLASIRVQRAPTGGATFTDVCTVSSSPASCSLNTTTLADGGYDLRAIATDVAGNTRTSVLVVNRVVDNTAPVPTDVQTTNRAGGTLGRPEAGDTVVYTFSEPVRPESVLAGWTGAATPVTVRMTQGTPDLLSVANAANSALLPLGSTAVGTRHVTATLTVPSSSMAVVGSTIVVTLGTPPSGSIATATQTVAMQWTPVAGPTDRAGNPLTLTGVAESGVADPEF